MKSTIGTKTEYIIEGYSKTQKRWLSFGDHKSLERAYKKLNGLERTVPNGLILQNIASSHKLPAGLEWDNIPYFYDSLS